MIFVTFGRSFSDASELNCIVSFCFDEVAGYN